MRSARIWKRRCCTGWLDSFRNPMADLRHSPGLVWTGPYARVMVDSRQSPVAGDRARLTPASLYAAAFGTLRARPHRVLPIAAAVGVVSGVLDLAVERIHQGDFTGARLV